MSSPNGLSRPTGLAAMAVSALLVASCASAPPTAERYVPPPTGATWSYSVTSTGSFGSGVNVKAVMHMAGPVVREGRTLLQYDTPAGATLQTDKVGVVAVLDRNGRLMMSYDPPLTYEWPLEVGKTWTQNLTLGIGANGATMPMTAHWKVEAYEDVTVPAGTFKAWRVVMVDNFGFKQASWSVPAQLGVFAKRISERSATHPQGGAGTQVFELLSVPTIK